MNFQTRLFSSRLKYKLNELIIIVISRVNLNKFMGQSVFGRILIATNWDCQYFNNNNINLIIISMKLNSIVSIAEMWWWIHNCKLIVLWCEFNILFCILLFANSNNIESILQMIYILPQFFSILKSMQRCLTIFLFLI